MKKEPRARQFMYVQDLDHLKVKEDDLSDILNKSGALEWAFIKHDKDPQKDEDGKIIRPHIHVVLKYENPQKVSTVANLFKDKSQYVDVWKGRIANARHAIADYYAYQVTASIKGPLFNICYTVRDCNACQTTTIFKC